MQWKFIQWEEQKEKKMSKNTLKDLCDTIKWTNMCIIEGPRSRRKRERGRKLSQRNITDNFPNLVKETDTEI